VRDGIVLLAVWPEVGLWHIAANLECPRNGRYQG
jgi:hypothetical protein